MGGPVLNRALAGDGSLHIVAELGEHRQTAAPDLLHLQLGSHIRVVGQTQRVKSLATRVHQIKVTSTEWTTVHTLSLDGTHQDNLAGQHGKDGLGAHQRGGTHVVQAIRLEDHGTSLEPHTFTGTIVDSSSSGVRHQSMPSGRAAPQASLLLQALRVTLYEAHPALPHSSPLHLAVRRPTSWHSVPAPPSFSCPLCLRTHCACNVRCKPVLPPLPLPLRARCLGTCVAVALPFSCPLVALLLPPPVVLVHYAKHYA